MCDLETTKNPREYGGDQGPLGGYRAKRKKNVGPQLGRITTSPELFNTTGDTNYNEYCCIRFYTDNEITASSEGTTRKTTLHIKKRYNVLPYVCE